MVIIALPTIECIIIQLPAGAYGIRITADGNFSYSMPGQQDEKQPMEEYRDYYPLGMLSVMSEIQYKNILEYKHHKQGQISKRLFKNYLDGTFAFKDPMQSFETLIQKDTSRAAEIMVASTHWFLCKKERPAAK
jgi:hypothetical protein